MTAVEQTDRRPPTSPGAAGAADAAGPTGGVGVRGLGTATADKQAGADPGTGTDTTVRARHGEVAEDGQRVGGTRRARRTPGAPGEQRARGIRSRAGQVDQPARPDAAGPFGPPPDPSPARSRRRIVAATIGSIVVGAAVLAVAVPAELRTHETAAGQGSSAPGASAAVAASPATRVATALAALHARPDDPDLLRDLGVAYLGQGRATADASYYTKADQAFRAADRAVPGDYRTLVGIGLLQLTRHEFTAALATGRRAAALAPASAEPLGVVVDAETELGRYPAATADVQAMVDRRPSMASLARVSYLREIQGDPDGALVAMTQASAAGSENADDRAYIATLLGDLLGNLGQDRAARLAYQEALGDEAGYPAAQVGLARLDAAAGNLASARTRLAEAARVLPLPETVALYGDVLAASGQAAEAAEQYRLVDVIRRLQAANGVQADFETARFEADHPRLGVPAATVALALRARAARPTVFADDVVAWALRGAGRPREALTWSNLALRLGTSDAGMLYHRAAIEADLGAVAAARRDLTAALAVRPFVSVVDQPSVTALASRLHVSGAAR